MNGDVLKKYIIRRDKHCHVKCSVEKIVGRESKTYPLTRVVYHSPTGFEVGYAGSGPADLALSILADCFNETPSRGDIQHGRYKCCGHHKKVKWEFIASMNRDGGEITSIEIYNFLYNFRKGDVFV